MKILKKIIQKIVGFPELPEFGWSKQEKKEFIHWNIAFFVLGIFYGIAGMAMYFTYSLQ